MKILRLSRFDRMVISVLLSVAILLGVIAVFGQQRGVPAPVMVQVGPVGVYGPVGIAFSTAMQTESVSMRLTLDPPIEGSYSWDDKILWFHPMHALQPGLNYRFRLAPGALSEDGRTLKGEVTLTFQVRPPNLIFLAPVSQGSDLWKQELSGTLFQLTHTGGKVYDFAPAPDGSQIVFSLPNEQSGMDLWMVDRSGSSSRRLLDCGVDWCSGPVWSPDGSKLVFSRRLRTDQSGGPKAARLSILDPISMQTTPLFEDPFFTASSPSWSPDGKYLSVFDQTSGGVRVIPLQSDEGMLVSANQESPAVWSPDSKKLAFIDARVAAAGQVIVRALILDVLTRDVSPLFSGDQDAYDFSVPAWSPDGNWLAVGIRAVTGSPSRQIWLERADGGERFAVTSAENYTHAGYRWDPTGAGLVFQRYPLNLADGKPELIYWDLNTRNNRLVAQDAALPAWLP